MTIYHITPKEYFKDQIKNKEYFSLSFDQEKFIHLSKKEQVSGTLQRYYNGKENLVLLHLDAHKMGKLLIEEPSTTGEMFPHLYGPILPEYILKIQNLSSITEDYNPWE